MQTPLKRIDSERGAVIIQIAICLLFLLAFASFVVDYGFMWVGRAQTQTAADAAALAGANSLSFDNTTVANVKARAAAVGKANLVWDTAPDILDTDIEIIPCPPSPGLPTGGECVRARAYRNQTRNNALPTFFANLVGVGDQGVQAMAVARPISANGTNCLKPWAVGDKWLDTQAGGWDQLATYDPVAGDSYVEPTPTTWGTGFSDRDANGVPTYHGYQMVLKLANPGQGANEIPINSAGWAMELELTNDACGGNCAYTNNITGCTSDDVGMAAPGTTCTVVNPAVGCLPVKTGSGGASNSKAVEDFIAVNDPGATWVNGAGVDGWKTGYISSSMTTSSRIVPVAVFDVPQYLAAGWNGSNGVIRVVNIVGFFLEGTCDTVAFKEPQVEAGCPTGGNAKAGIIGRLVNYPGIYMSTGSTVAGSFGQILVLVR